MGWDTSDSRKHLIRSEKAEVQDDVIKKSLILKGGETVCFKCLYLKSAHFVHVLEHTSL